MKVDRALQRKILEKLYEEHPYQITHQKLPSLHPDDPELVYANLVYLHGHGLVEVIKPNFNIPISSRDDELLFSSARITSQGIDFLENDGGLSAILKVVTVKLHEETLTALLQRRIQESDIPPADKSALTKQLESLGDEGAKHLLLKALDAGLAQAPNAMEWLTNLFKSS